LILQALVLPRVIPVYVRLAHEANFRLPPTLVNAGITGNNLFSTYVLPASRDGPVLVDVLTLTVLAFFGSRLIRAARESVADRARQRTVEIVRGLRPRHFLRAPLVLAIVLALSTVLLQIPGLSFGWWTAIGGTGNVIMGSTSRTSGTLLVWLVPAIFLALLIPALALFAEREEVVFRAGAETWNWGRRFAMGLRFGLIHLIMGIPIGVALALSAGGWYFQWAYLRGYHQGGPQAAVLESTRSHLAYNLEVLIIAAAYLLLVAR
jgi:hypothetical protein